MASHDLDIRGAGNLLGEEQSGHVKEVGVELYQHMLEEAVAELREGGVEAEGQWSPQINLGTSVGNPGPSQEFILGYLRPVLGLSFK